jgi:hypothetical protein
VPAVVGHVLGEVRRRWTTDTVDHDPPAGDTDVMLSRLPGAVERQRLGALT